MNSADSISRSALRKAARLATDLGAELELFYCAFDPDIIHPGRLSSRNPEEGCSSSVSAIVSLAHEMNAHLGRDALS